MSATLILAAALTLAGDNPVFRKTNLPAIKSLIVRRVGVKMAVGDQSAKCGDFVLSKSEALEVLSRAGEVTEREAWGDKSPCMVLGDVVFNNGLKGEWSIDQSRGGFLKLSSGRTLWIYCSDCHAKRFLPNK